MTDVQRTVIDNLYEESRSEMVIALEAGYSPGVVSKHIDGKFTGWKNSWKIRRFTRHVFLAVIEAKEPPHTDVTRGVFHKTALEKPDLDSI